MENWKDVSIDPIDVPRKEQLRYGSVRRRVIRRWLSYDPTLDRGERTVLPSLTTPDQSLSIPQLMARQAAGLPLYGHSLPIYDPEDDLPDLRTLDLAEIQELRERYSAEYQQITDQIKSDRQKFADAAVEKQRQMEALWKAHEASLLTVPPNSTNIT